MMNKTKHNLELTDSDIDLLMRVLDEAPTASTPAERIMVRLLKAQVAKLKAKI